MSGYVKWQFIHLAGLPFSHIHIAFSLFLYPNIQAFCKKRCHMFRLFSGNLVFTTDLICSFRIIHSNRICFFPILLIIQIGYILVIFRIQFTNINQIFVILNIIIWIYNFRTILIFCCIAGICQIHTCSCNDHQQRLFCI